MKLKLLVISLSTSFNAFAGGGYSDGVEYVYGIAFLLLLILLYANSVFKGLKAILIKGFELLIEITFRIINFFQFLKQPTLN